MKVLQIKFNQLIKTPLIGVEERKTLTDSFNRNQLEALQLIRKNYFVFDKERIWDL